MAMEQATFIAFESFPRYWSSQWFDNRSHVFNWSRYPARRFGMLTENATVDEMRSSVDAAIALHVGRFYVTDEIGRYDRLPLYWEQFVRYVAAHNRGGIRPPRLLTDDSPSLLAPGVFSDGMVLQRAPAAARLFGTASPQAAVTVTLQGHTAHGVADSSGRWIASLPPQPASAEGQDIAVSSGSASAKISGVLFGDVYLCGGQSNMAFALREAFNGSAVAAAGAGYNHSIRILNNGIM